MSTKDRPGGEERLVHHSYYTFTTSPVDINRLDALTSGGMSLVDAIDKLAMDDYVRMGWDISNMQR